MNPQMLTLFNPFSLSLHIGMSMLGMSLAYLIILQTCKTYPGFGKWTLSCLLVASGTLLIGLRDYVPAFASFFISHLCLIFSIILIKRGVFDFFKESQQPKTDAAIIVVSSALHWYFSFNHQSLHFRSLFLSISLSIISIQTMQILWKNRCKTVTCPGKFAFYSIGAFLLINVVRGFLHFYCIMHPIENSDIRIFSTSLVLMFPVFMIINLSLIVSNFRKTEISLIQAKEKIKTLTGFLPICAHCKKIRDDKNEWQPVEVYVQRNSHANFSHGICPECIGKHYPEFSNDDD